MILSPLDQTSMWISISLLTNNQSINHPFPSTAIAHHTFLSHHSNFILDPLLELSSRLLYLTSFNNISVRYINCRPMPAPHSRTTFPPPPTCQGAEPRTAKSGPRRRDIPGMLSPTGFYAAPANQNPPRYMPRCGGEVGAERSKWESFERLVNAA